MTIYDIVLSAWYATMKANKAHSAEGMVNNMGYGFDFEWGESWTVSEKDFEWDREYWYKVLARHIHFFREKVKVAKPVDLITSVSVYHNGTYIGMVGVSDLFVHVIMNDPHEEICMRVDEL